jgi:ABC transporter substrate binding protein
VRRREFISLLGGAAAAWPLAARAQQRDGMRRIGILSNLASDDAEGQARLAAFHQGLQQLGWTVGRNVQIDYRWGAGDADRIRKFAAELIVLAPDVILSAGSPSVAALQQATRTVPIVFVTVVDPVSSGFVDTLARPGGNITGFPLYEYSISGKWLQLLKEIAPHMTRAAVIRDPALTAGGGARSCYGMTGGDWWSPATGQPGRWRSANEIACALISMMARSTKGSNQRPDTLMQDRTSANSEKSSCNTRPDHTFGSIASEAIRAGQQRMSAFLRKRAKSACAELVRSHFAIEAITR